MANRESLLKEQIKRFSHAVEDFTLSVTPLTENMLLRKLGSWSPRDILAHLIGWNRYIIEGSEQLKRGELPFYDIDPGENYSNVNAVLVSKYSSENKQELLDELQTSAQELQQFLNLLNPTDLERDFGVRHNGVVITIQNTVDEYIEDYVHHRKQIKELIK